MKRAHRGQKSAPAGNTSGRRVPNIEFSLERHQLKTAVIDRLGEALEGLHLRACLPLPGWLTNQ